QDLAAAAKGRNGAGRMPYLGVHCDDVLCPGACARSGGPPVGRPFATVLGQPHEEPMESTTKQANSGTGRSFEKVSPVDGTPIGTFALATPREVNEAVARARRAWPAWRDTPLADRL